MKHKCPYSYPLKKKSDIIELLADHDRYDGYPLSWNVKTYSVDLDLNHLVDVFMTSHGIDSWDHKYFDMEFRPFRDFVESKYTEVEKELWGWGVEDAQRAIIDDDFHRMLWGGEDTKKVTFEFHGRSAGHLVVTEYEGMSLRNMGKEDFIETLESMDYKDILTLYKLTCQWDDEFTKQKSRRNIEECAAWTFFVNICAPNVSPDIINGIRAKQEKILINASLNDYKEKRKKVSPDADDGAEALGL